MGVGLNFSYGQISCGDQTVLVNDECVAEFFLAENFWLAIGVIAAAAGVAVAAVITVFDRKRDMRRRVQDLIQSYTDDFRNISDQERNLNTKLDCFLYCEQYLDALEMIATLSLKTDLKKEVSDYFQNNFSYGIHLWRWYMEKAVNFKEEDLDKLWDLPWEENILKIEEFSRKGKFDEDTKKYLDNERWRDFRAWCHTPPKKTQLDMKLERFQKPNVPKEKEYNILPDVMVTTDYDDIPEEDGLTKGELIQLIRNFGADIARIADDEKKLDTDLDCSVYAEKYLDILEQIASLYKKQVIPKRAADYFENKFTYGINLWKWYYEKILKYKHNDIDNLWNSEADKDSEGLDDTSKTKLTNERWRDFRWWCKKNKFESFEEKQDDRIILPDRMWGYGEMKTKLNNFRHKHF